MPPARKKYAFGPLFIALGAIATLVTICVAVLPVVTWVNGNAIWLPWTVVAVLIVAVMLLIARITAAKKAVEVADETIATEADETRKAVEAAKEARAALEYLQSAPTALSDLDRDLARQLFEYASDGELLTMLGSFFPYEIPQGPVRLIHELSELPTTRVARDVELERHFSELADAARTWRLKLLRVASTDGDHFSTKLNHHVSEAAYKQHSTMTDELGDAGFDLHEKFLAYQKYYASL